MAYPRRKHSGINAAQKALLHTAKRNLALDDAAYRAMLQSVAGVHSSSDLDLAGFQTVMRHLEDQGFKKNHAEHEFTGYAANLKKWQADVGDNRPDMATPAQLARIETDWDLMRWYWVKPDGFGNRDLSLRGFLARMAGGVTELRFLRFEAAHQIIEALKAIQNRGKVKSEK